MQSLPLKATFSHIIEVCNEGKGVYLDTTIENFSIIHNFSIVVLDRDNLERTVRQRNGQAA